MNDDLDLHALAREALALVRPRRCCLDKAIGQTRRGCACRPARATRRPRNRTAARSGPSGSPSAAPRHRSRARRRGAPAPPVAPASAARAARLRTAFSGAAGGALIVARPTVSLAPSRLREVIFPAAAGGPGACACAASRAVYGAPHRRRARLQARGTRNAPCSSTPRRSPRQSSPGRASAARATGAMPGMRRGVCDARAGRRPALRRVPCRRGAEFRDVRGGGGVTASTKSANP